MLIYIFDTLLKVTEEDEKIPWEMHSHLRE